jgi:hypothetical protein
LPISDCQLPIGAATDLECSQRLIGIWQSEIGNKVWSPYSETFGSRYEAC